SAFSSPYHSAHLVLHSFPTRRSSDLCGRTAMKLSAFSPSGDMRTCEVSLSICNSLPVLIPASAVTADIFEPRSNPASLPLNKPRSEEHTSELQSRENLVCRLLLEKKK